ncbi:MAG: oligosaccharide flippase family protein [Bacteroidia bacterium]|nr:oligosaccharide flippase family protein [Bacteroidia bacterium]
MTASPPLSALRAAWSSPLARKTVLYSTAMATNALLGVFVYSVLTRRLPVEDFGTYSFVIAFFLFTGMFFDFGIAPAGMRLMATTKDDTERASTRGALFVLSSGLGLLYMLAVVVGSFVVERFVHPGAGQVLLIMAPLAAVYPLQEMVFSVAQGESRMALLSAATVMPRILLAVVLLLFTGAAMTLTGAVFLTLLGMMLSTAFAIMLLRPGFSDLRASIAAVLQEVREYGRDIYAGRLVDGLTVGLDKMLLSLFHGMSITAYYSIAMTMSTPIAMGSKAVSHSAYKDFASEQRIPSRILMVSFGWSAFIGLCIGLGGFVLVPLFFTDSYAEALSVLPLLALGGILLGANHPFHAFLAARRQGRAIRIMSITTSCLNVVLNITLIPLIGMTGAALAFITTYAVNIGMNLWFYRKVVNPEATGL